MPPDPKQSKNEDNWKNKLAFLASYIPGSGILLITQFANSGQNEILLLFLEPLIAVAFGIVFFLPLWQRLDITHESDFIIRRFSGKGARVLFAFRNYYLALVIVPLLIALQIKSIDAFTNTSHLNFNYSTILFLVLSVVALVGYNIRRMISVESAIAAITLVATIVHLSSCSFHSELSNQQLVPLLDLKMLLPPLLFFWWFTGPVDMPDMRAQKLIAQNRISSNWIILPYSIIFLSQGIFLAIPIQSSEPYYGIIMFALSLNVTAVTLSLMYWATSLLQNQSAFFSKQVTIFKSTRFTPAIAAPVVLAFLWYSLNNESQDLFATFLLFAAGVGPVFILRWFSPRVNAWTQIAAMIGAIVIPPIVKMAIHTPSKYTLIFLCGMINCVIWIVVMIATQKKQEVELAREFISRLRSKEELLSGKNWFKFVAITALFAMLVTSILFLKNLNL